jgi:Fic family protein
MLKSMLTALNTLYEIPDISLQGEDRISIFKSVTGRESFTRKDYLQYFKTISPATASHDLKSVTEKGILSKTGDKRLSSYSYTNT